MSEPANRTLRIFISSPSDVAEERDRARQVIESLRRRYVNKFYLKPLLWEDLPLQIDMPFQEGIERVLSRRDGVHVAVFILWSRLGSPLGSGLRSLDGTQFRSGTEREFHLMLHARARSGGKRPAIIVYTRHDEASFEEKLRGTTTADKEQILQQRKLVESFVEENFQDAEGGGNLRAYHSFDRPTTFSQRLRAHLVELLDEIAGDMHQTVWDCDKLGPPFLGLSAFEKIHAEVFFGRELETLEARFALQERARAGCAFLLLCGASGSGKSSLAQAGLLPEIVENEIDDQIAGWKWLIVTPSELGSNPVLTLVRRLAEGSVLPALRRRGAALETLAQDLATQPEVTIRHAIRPLLERGDGRGTRLLLVIDQLEEVFAAHVMTGAERGLLLNVLQGLATSGVVWVVATARSDFYHQIQQEPALARMLHGRGPMAVIPPGPAALQRLIEEPARLAGLRFEQKAGISLADKILREAANHSELLPLVGFLLRELYEGRRSERLLTFECYGRLGGVEGAIGRRAQEVLRELPAESSASLQEILPLLVGVESEGEQAAVRRRASLKELRVTGARAKLIDALIANRLVTTGEQAGVPHATLAHEALLRCWGAVSEWIALNREKLRMRSRVEQSQQRWQLQQRDASLLLPAGLPLEEGRRLREIGTDLLAVEVAEYIDLSIEGELGRRRRSRRRNRTIMSLMAALTLAAIAGGFVAYFQKRAADDALVVLKSQTEKVKSKDLDLGKSREETTREVYNNAIALAERELSENQDFSKARRLLLGDQCPERLKGWEWHYLKRRLDGPSQPLAGHDLGLWSARFSPDGKQIATCGIDGTVRFWDARSGLCTMRINADNVTGLTQVLEAAAKIRLPIMCCEYSPNGEILATGSFLPTPNVVAAADPLKMAGRLLNDGLNVRVPQPELNRNSPSLIRLWNTRTGKLLREFTGQQGVVLTLSFSPDGRQIAASSINEDCSFVVIDAQNCSSVGRVRGHSSHIHSLKYRPDGKVLAAAETSGKIRLWNATTFEVLKEWQAHEAPVIGLAWSRSDPEEFASCGQDGYIRLWNAQTGEKKREMAGHMSAVLDIQYSPDGSRIASAGLDQTVRMWDSQTGEEKITLRGHEDQVWRVDFSPDGNRLLSASFDKTARLWEAGPATESLRPGLIRIPGHADRVNQVEISRDGQRLVSAGWDKTIRVTEMASGREIARLTQHQSPVWCARMSPNGQWIASAGWDRQCLLWEVATGRAVRKLEGHSAPVQAVCFDRTGERLATAGFDGRIIFWDLKTGSPRMRVEGFLFPIMSLAFDPQREVLASGGSDRSLHLWNSRTGDHLQAYPGHSASIFSLSYNAKGTRLATASWDHTVRIWNVERDGSVSGALEVLGHLDRVNAVAFSPDDRLIATGSQDKTVRLWDATTGRQVGKTEYFQGAVWSVAFGPKDGRLYAGSWAEDGYVQSWKVSE